VYSNVTGKPVSSAEEARRLAGEQITSTVLWVNIEKNLLAGGYERVLEAGPGTVLAGLWKAVCAGFPCAPAGTVEAIEAVAGKQP
jgi:[acyl-carrier-protein] S-malonyltransferase